MTLRTYRVLIGILAATTVLGACFAPAFGVTAAYLLIVGIAGRPWLVADANLATGPVIELRGARDTDVEVMTRFVFSRAKLSSYLAAQEMHRGRKESRDDLLQLFSILREHEADLDKLYLHYQSKYSFQEIADYYEKLNCIRIGTRWTIPEQLKPRLLHHE